MKKKELTKTNYVRKQSIKPKKVKVSKRTFTLNFPSETQKKMMNNVHIDGRRKLVGNDLYDTISLLIK